MRRLFPLLLVVILLSSSASRAQDFWQPANGLLPGPVNTLIVNSNGHIFAGLSIGIFRSTDKGGSWAKLNLAGVDVKSLALSSSGQILAGTSGGVFRSTDNGGNWVLIGLRDTLVMCLAINASGHVFVGTADWGILRSTNGGASWNPSNSGFSTRVGIRSVAVNSAGYIFAATSTGVFRSTNNGTNWVQVGLANSSVRSLTIDGSGRIFVGGDFGGVLMSTDNGGNWVQTGQGQTLAITSLDKSSAAPFNFLTIAGSGFDTRAALSVSFFDNKGFKVNIPVLVARSTSVTVAVPPYINPSTGTFGPATFSVQVVQNSGGSIVTSNTIQNLQVDDLPTTVAPPGAVALDLLKGIIDFDLQLQGSLKGTLLDTPELNAAIAHNITNLQGLVIQIQAVMQTASPAFTLGSIKGNNAVIESQALMKTDRMIIGMLKSLINTIGPAPVIMNGSVEGIKISQQDSLLWQREVTDPCEQEKNDYLNAAMATGGLPPGNGKYLGYGGCTSFGIPEAVKTATQVIVGAGTATMGFFGLGGAPAIALALPSAALFNAEIMSIVTQIDVAAALKNVNNAAAYKAMHEAVDETEDMLKNFLLGLVIPETVGDINDIYTGSASFIQAFKNTNALVPILSCTYVISPTSATIPSSGGGGSVSVATASGCTWTASSSQSWISLTTGINNSGNGTVGFLVRPNTSSSQRTGAIAIESSRFSITQDGSSSLICTYVISPTSATIPSSGGGGFVSVKTSDSCSWTATSGAAWLTVTSGNSGRGNGTVGYSVVANTSSQQRTSSISISDQNFAVTQAGSSGQAGALDGDWAGTYDGIFTYVSGSKYVWKNEPITPNINIKGTAITGALPYPTLATGSIDASGNATWHYSPPLTPFIFTGTFAGGGTASGTWTLSIPGTGGQAGTGSGTWTATRK